MRFIFKFFIFMIFLVQSQSTFAKTICFEQKIEFTDNEFTVQVSKFQSYHSNKKSILIIPPTGGTNLIDQSYGKYFCENNFDVYILNHWTNDNEMSFDLEIHERLYARAFQAIELTLSHISSPFIGILGTSVGAIHTANAVQRLSRLDAAFFIVGGAPIADVIAYSDQEILVQARRKRFEIFNFKDNNEYIEALSKTLSFDPLKKPANEQIQIGMVIANNDKTVPVKNQLDLQKALSPKLSININGGHIYTVIKTWIFKKNEILQFFNQALQ